MKPISSRVNLGVCLAFAVGMALSSASAQSMNGFDLSRATIPLKEIRSGGPSRDGILSIDHPRFIVPEQADFMRANDLVVSVSIGGETRAYPLKILNWHEIVNDQIGDKPINVSYCPLCDSAMVFEREFDGRMLQFGVSGLLYQSDVLMYDRQTQSLWSQLQMAAVSGPLVGRRFSLLPAEHMTWKAWRAEYPNGQVLSTETRIRRDYQRDAYAGYRESADLMFPVAGRIRRDLTPKTLVAGIVIDGAARAYPLRRLPNGKEIEDTLNGRVLRIRYDRGSKRFRVMDEAENPLAFVPAYWFAWQAFHPETTVWAR